jgi:hypothetical protein
VRRPAGEPASVDKGQVSGYVPRMVYGDFDVRKIIETFG